MKINRYHLSFPEYLIQEDLVPGFIENIYKKMHPLEYDFLVQRTYPHISFTDGKDRQKNLSLRQVYGSFQPFVSIGKDFIDTFKPYKSGRYALRDFLQPFRGIGNILKGAFSIVGGVVEFLVETVRCIFGSGSWRAFKYKMKVNCSRSFSWITSGVSNIFRGTTQIVATPLTWFIKMPLRGIITEVKGKPKIEDNSKIKELVAKGYQAIKDDDAKLYCDVRRELHRKFTKGYKKGQKTEINHDPKNQDGDFDVKLQKSRDSAYKIERYNLIRGNYREYGFFESSSKQDARAFLNLFDGNDRNSLI